MEDRAVEALCSLHTVLAAEAADHKAPREKSTRFLDAPGTDQTQSQQHPPSTGEAFWPQAPSSPPSSEPSPSRPQQRPRMPGSGAGRQARPQQAQQGASAGGKGEEDSGPGGRRWPGVSVSHKRTWNNDKTTWRAVVLLDRKNHQVAVHGLASQEEAGCARDLLFAWREAYFGGRPSDAAPICIFPFSLYAPHLEELVKCRTEAAVKAFVKSLRDGGMLCQLASTAAPRESPLHPWPAPAPLRSAEELGDPLPQPPPAPKPASMAFQVAGPVAQGPPAPLSPAPKKPRHPSRPAGKAAAGTAGQPAGSPPPSAFLQPLALPVAPLLPGPLPPVTTWGAGTIPGLSTPTPEQPAPAAGGASPGHQLAGCRQRAGAQRGGSPAVALGHAGSGGFQEGSPLPLTTQRSSSGTIVVVTAASASEPVLKLAGLLAGSPQQWQLQQHNQQQQQPAGDAAKGSRPSTAPPSPLLITSTPVVTPRVAAAAADAANGAAGGVKIECSRAPAAPPSAPSPLPALAGPTEQAALCRPRSSPAGGAALQVPEVAQRLEAAVVQASGGGTRPASSPEGEPWAESHAQPGYWASQANHNHSYQRGAHPTVSSSAGKGSSTQGLPRQQLQAGGYPKGVATAAADPPPSPPPSFSAPAVQQQLLCGLLAQQALPAQHAQQNQQQHAPTRDPRLSGPAPCNGNSPGTSPQAHLPPAGAHHSAGNLSAHGRAPASAGGAADGLSAAGAAGAEQGGLAGGMESGRALLALWSILGACGVAEREIATFCTTWVCGFSGERKAVWYQGIKESYRRGDAAMARLWLQAALSR
ncbi:hypothetical protein N2152v2_005274 [Parachlorella kessleri]